MGADVVVGLSAGGVLKPEPLKLLPERPIIFALADPDPEVLPSLAREVLPSLAREVRHDAVVATARRDLPNHIDNIFELPCIFRGALDVRVDKIDEAMKIAAVRAIAALAREPVPAPVTRA